VVREGLADSLRGRALSIPSMRYKALAVVGPLLPGRLVNGPARRLKQLRGQ